MYLQAEGDYVNSWLIASLDEDDINLLEINGYIENNSLTDKGKSLFENDKDDSWEEFKKLYPKKDGERRLIDKEEKCKEKFFTLLKGKGSKDEIIKGLKNEMKAREVAISKRQFFPPPKMMSTWLNNKCWMTYLDYTEEDPSENERFKTI